MQVQRIDHGQLDPAPGQVLQVAQPFLDQRFAGGHQQPLAVHRQRQEAMAARIGVGDQRGDRGDVDPGRIDPQVAGAGARGQPFGKPLQAQLAAAAGGQLQVGQQHQRVHFTGVAGALGGKTDALQVGLGDQPVGHQRGDHLLEVEPARGQRQGRAGPDSGAGNYRWALVHPPKSS
ncbi:hypothetical protein D3C71_1569290 [compost metagenome]